MECVWARRLHLYMFWHLLFAFLFALLLCRLIAANPAMLYVATVTSAGTLMDVDHLLAWNPENLSKLIPTYLWEGLTFSFRTSVYPMILHLWLWPLLLVAAALLFRNRSAHKYLLAGAAGWALHLALDGVLVLL